MARAPYQILVFPFHRDDSGKLRFAIFHRSDRDLWQAVSGGGEAGETVLQSAVRETNEETGTACAPETFIPLQSKAMIPAHEFPEGDWGTDITEIPEYSFGVEFLSDRITLSDEHTQFLWLEIEKARTQLYWPSNVRALDELYQKLTNDN